MKQGQSQRFQLVLRGPFPLTSVGGYHWVLILDDERTLTTNFWLDTLTLPKVGPASAQGS